MPKLQIYTTPDAEIFVMDGALALKRRGVGELMAELEKGLYKVRVDRAGALREQIVALEGDDTVYLFVDDFRAVAPIGPLLGADGPAVEQIAAAALAQYPSKPNGLPARILLLAHGDARDPGEASPFTGARLFPWGARKAGTALGRSKTFQQRTGSRVWTATAVDAALEAATYVLELRHGSRISRQAVLLVNHWQTRIFLRRREGPENSGGFDVSIQMARPGQPVVYDDHYQTIEVARTALEKGRAIFASPSLLRDLLYGKFDNPIAGLTGLHLYLDAKARWDAGDRTLDLAALTGNEGGPDAFVDTVLANLAGLLGKDVCGRDPADLTALRIRAGRQEGQAFIAAPPMFRASWEALKANAAADGKAWISRKLWRGTGDAVAFGPYIAWSPKARSVRRSVDSWRREAARSWAGEAVTDQHVAEAKRVPLSLFQAPRPHPREDVQDLEASAMLPA